MADPEAEKAVPTSATSTNAITASTTIAAATMSEIRRTRAAPGAVRSVHAGITQREIASTASAQIPATMPNHQAGCAEAATLTLKALMPSAASAYTAVSTHGRVDHATTATAGSSQIGRRAAGESRRSAMADSTVAASATSTDSHTQWFSDEKTETACEAETPWPDPTWVSTETAPSWPSTATAAVAGPSRIGAAKPSGALPSTIAVTTSPMNAAIAKQPAIIDWFERRFGPYNPVGGPIPLHRYRARQKTKGDERADRIAALAERLGLPRAALEGNPDLAGVMSSTDEGALGAMGAFASAGKTLTCNVDFGGNDEVLGNVKSGKIYASVALQFQDDMTQSFDTLVKMQANPTQNGEVLVVPQKIVTNNG